MFWLDICPAVDILLSGLLSRFYTGIFKNGRTLEKVERMEIVRKRKKWRKARTDIFRLYRIFGESVISIYQIKSADETSLFAVIQRI